MALIDKASLLMVPSTYEAGTLYNVLPSGNRAPDSTDQNSGYDQTRADFTFDRGSNAAATRVNSDGLIEKYRENLLTESNNFSDSDWTTSNASVTSGQIGYDDSSDAWLLTKTAASGRLYQNLSASGVLTFSVYMKANASTWGLIQVDGSPNDAYVYVDLQNGTTGSTSSVNIVEGIEDVGNNWYRVSVSVNDVVTRVRIYPAETNSASATTGSIYIQNAQLESGMVSTDYLDSGATTAKAGVLIDLPRINYDANGENGALLLEPQRANLVQYSEYFEHSSWDTGATTADISKSPNLSPEGVANCYYVENVSGGQLGFYTTITSGASYTGSFWVRKVSGSGVVRMLNVNNSSTDFNVDTEWTRVSVTATSTSNTGRCYVQARNTGDIIEVYGAQLEAGSYSTSYIPNHGESGGVTRAADSCSVTGVSDVIGQTEGTLFLDLNPLEFADSSRYLSIESSSGAGSGWIGIFAASPNQFRFYGDGFDFNIGGYSVGDRAKIALTYKNGVSTNVYINGVNKGSITANTNSKNYSILKLGYAVIGGVGAGEFNQCTIFPTALTDAECITLTTL